MSHSKMGRFLKSPLHKGSKHSSVDSGINGSKNNPFDSDNELDSKQTLKPVRRSGSEPVITAPNSRAKLFDDYQEKGNFSSSAATSSNWGNRNRYKYDFRDDGGIENQSVQELENYAVYKSEETTKTVNNCLKIAEDMRDDATKTLTALHQQGEQINRTHLAAADMDQDLSRGEKLLGSLGGMFSKTWKPKKNRQIMGPMITRDDSFIRRNSHLEQRERLGLTPAPRPQSKSRVAAVEPTNAYEKIEVEKEKQDDALSNISNILDELKIMAVDMGSEIGRQNKAIDNLHEDVGELNFRVEGANRRGRKLLGK
ncbi:hypothetical protein RJ641_014624 [Dillenia turbinata]|uniref:t-SNARE coiled-coil homology domain-containing protein n=1 Tax=Dillenia turbinata TaxID=194707 RepID=A0AAN8UZL6_9MAGN